MFPHLSDSVRLLWIDIAKGLAMILVIFGHAPGMGIVRNVIYSFHMPIFFILAGYTFSLNKNFATILASSAKRLLLPYILVWASSCGFCYLLFDNPFNIEALKQLIWGSAGSYEHPVFKTSVPPIGVAWFFWTLFWARLIFWLILKLSQAERLKSFALTMLIFACGYVLGNTCPLPMNLDIACACTAFMLAGFEMKQLKLPSRYAALSTKYRLLLIAAVVLLWSPFALFRPVELAIHLYGPYGLYCWGSVFGSLVTFILCKEIERLTFLRRFLTFIGVNSMLLFCFHHLEKYIVPREIIYRLFAEHASSPFLTLAIGAKGVLFGLLVALIWNTIESGIKRLRCP